MRITEESMKQNNPHQHGPGQMTDVPVSAPRQSEPQLTEREKLKAMSRRDQLWYIWEYYKWLIIGAVIAAFMLFSIGKAVYMSTFKTALHIVTINSQTVEELSMTAVTDDFHAQAGLNRKDRVISEALFIKYGDEATDYSLSNMAKISAMASAKEIDVIIADTANIDHYATVGAFHDLETVLSPELLETFRDRLYYTEDEAGVPYAFAIDISDTDFAANCKFTQEITLLSLVSNTERMDTALALIEYALK